MGKSDADKYGEDGSRTFGQWVNNAVRNWGASGRGDLLLDSAQATGGAVLTAFGMGSLAGGLNTAIDAGEAAVNRKEAKAMSPEFVAACDQLHAYVTDPANVSGWVAATRQEAFAAYWIQPWTVAVHAKSDKGWGGQDALTLQQHYYTLYPADASLPGRPAGRGEAWVGLVAQGMVSKGGEGGGSFSQVSSYGGGK